MTQTATIETVEETGSTNADLLARLAKGEAFEDNYWLRAKRQAGGRGRLGRHWESPEGNLFCSTIVHLAANGPPAHTLSFVAGLAVHDTLIRSLLPKTPIMLKWPNDAQVEGAKIAGILLERMGDQVVVGLGINVCHAPSVPGRKTTSIVFENGKHGGNPALVLEILAECFAARLERWRSEPLAMTLDAWTAAAHPIGTRLTTDQGGNEVSGTFAGLDADGALLLRLANGAMHTIHAGDVSMITDKDS